MCGSDTCLGKSEKKKMMDNESLRWWEKLRVCLQRHDATDLFCFFVFQSMLSGHTCSIEHEGSTWCHRTSPLRGATSTRETTQNTDKEYSQLHLSTSPLLLHIQHTQIKDLIWCLATAGGCEREGVVISGGRENLKRSQDMRHQKKAWSI